MTVLRKILFGVLWFIVFDLGSAMLIGGVVGGIAGTKDPQHAAQAGGAAAQQMVSSLVPYMFAGALLAAVLGASFGVLPGTKSKPKAAAPPPAP